MKKQSNLKDNFYIIYLVNTVNLEKLYVGIGDKGQIVLHKSFVSDLVMFRTYPEAQKFSTDNGLDKLPEIKFYITDLNDLLAKSNPMDIKEPLYTVENQAGWKLFFSDVKREYYWDNKPVGAVCVHQAWIDGWLPRLKKKYPNMEIKLVPIGDKASMVKL